MADYSSELHPDEMCPNCVTPWKCNGPHYTPEQAAIWKAGREAGMREAAALADKIEDEFIAEANEPDTIGTYSRHCGDCASGAGSVMTAILAAIEGKK